MIDISSYVDTVINTVSPYLPTGPGPVVVVLVAVVALAWMRSRWSRRSSALDSTRPARRRSRGDRPAGTTAFYIAAAASLAVSVNTSWRFAGERLHVDNVVERAAMFAVVEWLLIACAIAMRASMRRHGKPGPARIVAWSLCAVHAYVAWSLSGPVEGSARVLLGPVLGIVSLHLALGMELRHRHGTTAGTWGRITAEIRERVLSRLGLGDDTRDALTRSRDRAALRAARLVYETGSWRRTWRLSRALRISGVAHNETRRRMLLAELAVLRYANQLGEVELASPWDISATAADRALCQIVRGQTRTASERIAAQLAAMPATAAPAGTPILRNRSTTGTMPSAEPVGSTGTNQARPEAGTAEQRGTGTADATPVPEPSAAEPPAPASSGTGSGTERNQARSLAASSRHGEGNNGVVIRIEDHERNHGKTPAQAAMRDHWDREVAAGRVPDAPALYAAAKEAGHPVTDRNARKYAARWRAELEAVGQ